MPPGFCQRGFTAATGVAAGVDVASVGGAGVVLAVVLVGVEAFGAHAARSTAAATSDFGYRCMYGVMNCRSFSPRA
jgi:hypothetical protein